MDGLIAAMAANPRWANFSKLSISAGAGNAVSLWDTDGTPGAGVMAIGNTSAGLVPTNATAGAIGYVDYTGGLLGYLARFDLDSNSVVAGFVLYDRLFHVGSFVLSSLTTFTLASQPSYSARVPTDYSETEIWIEMASAISSSTVMVSVGYTNSAGTSGRTATMPTANLASFIKNRMLCMQLQSGDGGVQKIDSVTISGATATGTVNVLVMRRIASRGCSQAGMGGQIIPSDPISSGMRRIYPSSCLALLAVTSTTSTGSLVGTFCQIGG